MCAYREGLGRLGDAVAEGMGDTFGDAWMRQTMNPEEAGGWRRLADSLIRAMAQRDAAEQADAPQAEFPDELKLSSDVQFTHQCRMSH